MAAEITSKVVTTAATGTHSALPWVLGLLGLLLFFVILVIWFLVSTRNKRRRQRMGGNPSPANPATRGPAPQGPTVIIATPETAKRSWKPTPVFQWGALCALLLGLGFIAEVGSVVKFGMLLHDPVAYVKSRMITKTVTTTASSTASGIPPLPVPVISTVTAVSDGRCHDTGAQAQVTITAKLPPFPWKAVGANCQLYTNPGFASGAFIETVQCLDDHAGLITADIVSDGKGGDKGACAGKAAKTIAFRLPPSASESGSAQVEYWFGDMLKATS